MWQVFDSSGRLKTIASSTTTLPSLTNDKIWIGDGTNSAVERSVSGAISLSNTGITSYNPDPTFTGNVTLNSNVTFTPTVNNSLSGANQRIPSHTTANIVFTNAGLTSIGSANNGGVTGGHTLAITNETGGNLVIVNNYGSAAAGEAIYTGSGADRTISNHGTFWLQYNATASAWIMINGGLVPLTSITGFGTGVATFLATPSSANLQSAVTDETGTGTLVFSDSPGLTGIPTAPTASSGTNNTQIATTQFVIQNEYICITCNHGAQNFTDSTTYYSGAISLTAAPSTTAATRKTPILYNSTLVGAYIGTNQGNAASGESSTVSFRLNDTTDTTLSSSVIFSAGSQVAAYFTTTSLNVSLSAGDFFEIKMVCPNWATNPINGTLTVTLFLKLR